MKSLLNITLAAFLACALPAIAAHHETAAPSIKVGTYEQEVGETLAAGLPSTDVLSIAVAPDGTVYAGTANGLARLTQDGWTALSATDGMAIEALTINSNGAAGFVSGGTAYRMDGDSIGRSIELPEGYTAVNAIAESDTAVALATGAGLLVYANGSFSPATELDALLGDDKAVRQVVIGSNGDVAVAAAAGLFTKAPSGDWTRALPQSGTRSWAPVDVRSVAYDGAGTLWFASPQGVGSYSGEWTLYTGHEGLPYNDFTLATAAKGDDAVWFGTHIGAIRFDGKHFGYREGRRWLPDNDVRGIAVTDTGNAYVATSAGVGLIERRPMTLAEKAKIFEEQIETYNRRTPYSYVLHAILDNPGDLSSWEQTDSDNDGLYTGVYGAGQAFAYAATGNPIHKERAKRSFKALAHLSEVTQGGANPAPYGFPARTILPTDGPNPNDGRIARDIKKQAEDDAIWKTHDPRWPTSADGKWFWKSDTSSDELDGHFFFYGIYYDHCAETEEEKAEVREVVGRVAGHLADHDFQLVDHDGTPTRWARFGPQDLNESIDWWFERGLNSLSVLAHMRVALHVTGDPKFAEALERLDKQHKYVMNSLQAPKVQSGPGSFVQFDDIMAFMNYYHYLMYEDNKQNWDKVARGFWDYWDIERYEINPVYNFIFATQCYGKSVDEIWGPWPLTPKYDWLEKSVDTLKRYPLNLLNWRQTNSHRIDVAELPPHVREHGETEGTGYRLINGEVLPIDERYLSKWGDDVWDLDTGGAGNALNDGSPFLLAYYMGLYHGFITE